MEMTGGRRGVGVGGVVSPASPEIINPTAPIDPQHDDTRQNRKPNLKIEEDDAIY
jgi:hypothetical protein